MMSLRRRSSVKERRTATPSFLDNTNNNNNNNNNKIYYDFVYVNNEQIRFKLTDSHLILQKELTFNNFNINQILNETDLSVFLLQNNQNDYQHFAFASSIINQENNEKLRVVKLKRDPIHGLGLCVKGGKEHGLPLLISNMFPNQPSAQSGELKIGDAILKVNDIDISQLTHDEAVHILKTTNSSFTTLNFSTATAKQKSIETALMDYYDVILTVKNYSLILEKFLQSNQQIELSSRQNEISLKQDTEQEYDYLNNTNTSINNASGGENDNSISNNDAAELNLFSYKNWIDLISIPLELAHITQYIAGTDRTRDKAFEVYSKNGISSGVIECENINKKTSLIQRLYQYIKNCNQYYVSNINKTLTPSNQVIFICWAHERLHSSQNLTYWNRVFIALKGADCYLFENCDLPVTLNDWNRCNKVYKVYESLFKLIREHERLDERRNCFVLHNCNGTAHYMNIDLEENINQLEKHWQRALYTSVYSIGETLWSYQFAQLKTSTDDNKTKVQFYFQDPLTKRIEVKSLECRDLYCLLYVIHSFLTAKLTSVHMNNIK